MQNNKIFLVTFKILNIVENNSKKNTNEIVLQRLFTGKSLDDAKNKAEYYGKESRNVVWAVTDIREVDPSEKEIINKVTKVF